MGRRACAAICACTTAKSSELTRASWVMSVDQIQSELSFHLSFVWWPTATSSASISTSSRRRRFQTLRPVCRGLRRMDRTALFDQARVSRWRLRAGSLAVGEGMPSRVMPSATA